MKTLVKMSFDPRVAKEVGTDAAIIYENIKYWIDKNRANEKCFHEGTWWTYNSQKAFSVQFTWLTRQQIRTCLTKLEEVHLIQTGNYNRVKYDRTTWYALSNHCISEKQQMDWLKSTNGVVENNQPIPNGNNNERREGDTHPISSGEGIVNGIKLFNIKPVNQVKLLLGGMGIQDDVDIEATVNRAIKIKRNEPVIKTVYHWWREDILAGKLFAPSLYYPFDTDAVLNQMPKDWTEVEFIIGKYINRIKEQKPLIYQDLVKEGEHEKKVYDL